LPDSIAGERLHRWSGSGGEGPPPPPGRSLGEEGEDGLTEGEELWEVRESRGAGIGCSREGPKCLAYISARYKKYLSFA